MVWSLAFTPDGRRLAIGQQGIDGRPSVLRIWDLADKQDVIWFVSPAAYRSVAFSPDGTDARRGDVRRDPRDHANRWGPRVPDPLRRAGLSDQLGLFLA